MLRRVGQRQRWTGPEGHTDPPVPCTGAAQAALAQWCHDHPGRRPGARGTDPAYPVGATWRRRRGRHRRPRRGASRSARPSRPSRATDSGSTDDQTPSDQTPGDQGGSSSTRASTRASTSHPRPASSPVPAAAEWRRATPAAPETRGRTMHENDSDARNHATRRVGRVRALVVGGALATSLAATGAIVATSASADPTSYDGHDHRRRARPRTTSTSSDKSSSTSSSPGHLGQPTAPPRPRRAARDERRRASPAATGSCGAPAAGSS